jgi:drug/metabolite transporter (DMT)-like permease
MRWTARLLSIFSQTASERAAYRSALALFFGALLGVNLGLLEGLPLRQYLTAVAILAGVVMGLQLVSHARNRAYALAAILGYAAILVYVYQIRSRLFPGLDDMAVDRLFATIGMWLASMLIVEATPLIEEDRRGGKDPPE